jgi:hypothetical protein
MLATVRALLSGPPIATARQIASFAIAFLIANAAFKFGSFGLELVAFLATWLALDAALAWVHERTS